MKLLLSMTIVFGGLILTQNSYGDNTRVSGNAGQNKTQLTVLPCGKLVSKGLIDGTCKKDALSGDKGLVSKVSGK